MPKINAISEYTLRMSKDKKRRIWLVAGIVLFTANIFIFQFDSLFRFSYQLLDSLAIGGLLAVINYRFKMIWFMVALLIYLAFTFYKAELFHKFFHTCFSWEIFSYAISMFFMFNGFLSMLGKDTKILRIVIVSFSAKAVPLLAFYAVMDAMIMVAPNVNDFLPGLLAGLVAGISMLYILAKGFFWIKAT